VAWDGVVPDWLAALADECDATSQAQAAERIGFSRATVSLVLSGKYRGSLPNVARAIRITLMSGTVECPILGEISEAECDLHQRAPFSSSNSMRVRLYKACRSCRHNAKQ
jgi:DNA-binding XRE family transcriptional regulator